MQQTILITAGPTQEAIDPVRYLSNYSSGKMGYALAEVFQQAGHQVYLISGPTNLTPPAGVEVVAVLSALDMLAAVQEKLALGVDIFIGTAAVADYRPKASAASKIKKSNQDLQLSLVPNPDILSYVANYTPRPLVVGFCAETENLLSNAWEKLQRKKADLIFANLVAGPKLNCPARGFMSDENQVILVAKQYNLSLPQLRKIDLARKIYELIMKEVGSRS